MGKIIGKTSKLIICIGNSCSFQVKCVFSMGKYERENCLYRYFFEQYIKISMNLSASDVAFASASRITVPEQVWTGL